MNGYGAWSALWDHNRGCQKSEIAGICASRAQAIRRRILNSIRDGKRQSKLGHGLEWRTGGADEVVHEAAAGHYSLGRTNSYIHGIRYSQRWEHKAELNPKFAEDEHAAFDAERISGRSRGRKTTQKAQHEQARKDADAG